MSIIPKHFILVQLFWSFSFDPNLIPNNNSALNRLIVDSFLYQVLILLHYEIFRNEPQESITQYFLRLPVFLVILQMKSL